MMAEQTYQDYKRSKSGLPPVERTPETPAETPVVEAPVPDPQAVTQDSPPVVLDDDSSEDPTVPESDETTRSRRQQRTDNRFKRLNDRARVLERENAELKGRVDTLQEIASPPRGGREPQTVQPDGKPSRANYDEEDEFFEALIDWKTTTSSQAQEKMLKQQEVERQRDAETEQQTAFATRTTAAKERYDDYDEVVGESDVHLDPPVVEEIVSSDLGPDLVYYLAKHPDEAKKLNAAKTPVALGRALARLESIAQPQSSPSPPSPVPALPPTPITPVGGANTGPPVIREPGKLPYQDYKAGRKSGRIR